VSLLISRVDLNGFTGKNYKVVKAMVAKGGNFNPFPTKKGATGSTNFPFGG
jgi:hypothetical protein